MSIKETGFRPFYHNICAIELNDKLRERIKDCPDANKSSHAVVYGYIDAKKGFMLEILGGGKQGPKYFNFKAPNTGKRITIAASDVEEQEFLYFEKLEPRFHKQYAPQTDKLKKYDAPAELEETRGLGFLDALRDLQHPDDVRVVLQKDGLKNEEVWVRMTGTGEHVLKGTLLNQPYQNYGINKGDAIEFNVHENEDKSIVCFIDLNEEKELTKEDLDNGNFLKFCIGEYQKDKDNDKKLNLLFGAIRSSKVVLPCDIQLSDEAKAISDRLQKEGKDIDSLEGEDAETFRKGMRFVPKIFTKEEHKFLPVFTDEDEMGQDDDLQGSPRGSMPFLTVIQTAQNSDVGFDGIVINAFTDDFIVPADLFETIANMAPILDEPQEDSELLKALQAYKEDDSSENTQHLIDLLLVSDVYVPLKTGFTEEARPVLERKEKEDITYEDLSDEEKQILEDSYYREPVVLTPEDDDSEHTVPVFTDEKILKADMEPDEVGVYKFPDVMRKIAAMGDTVSGIVINPYTECFVLVGEAFDQMLNIINEEAPEEDAGTAPEAETLPVESYGDERIKIAVGKMDSFNYALSQNNVPPIRNIEVVNATGDPLKNLSMRITSDYAFFKPYEEKLPEIPSGKPVVLPNPHLIVDGPTLAGLNEAVNANVTVELRQKDETLCGCRGQMKVLAYDQFPGFDYVNYLPAFVLPNHPAIPMFLHEVGQRLEKWGKPSAIDGYQSGDPNRVRDLAAAAYAAIQKKNITYATSPANLWEPGQRIRTPEIILDQHLGNCMDMTLLYAACLEAMGLHPILYAIRGHIFAGVWLIDHCFEDICIRNPAEIKGRMGKGTEEIILVECTAMCSGNNVSFEDAEAYPEACGNLSDDVFDSAIDVFCARLAGIKPIPSRTKNTGEFSIAVPDLQEENITAAPATKNIIISGEVASTAHKPTTKRELWESKLLNLGEDNMLLNLPHNASVEPVMSSHVDELEDALADGHEFRLQPAPEWILNIGYVEQDKNGNTKETPWLPKAIKEEGIYEIHSWPILPDVDLNEKFRQEYHNHRLYTFCTEKQLERELTGIYRAAKASQQENGVSSLYLAIGLLRWFDPKAKKPDKPNYAPLILVPVEIVRKSANQGFALHEREDEPHFNTTLLEMLRQNYNLEINGVDPLPVDDHGIDIRTVFAIVRKALFSLKNWNVIETCVIGNFSFGQFAMWNDIHSSGDLLEKSDIVRSLMKGHVDWNTETETNTEDPQVLLPITVDATQLRAIQMAAQGKSFVLHGPPGTGKSQTITGMIANLMAQGKKVLFVAEKEAALSVVERRLDGLGIGDFCLEVYSEKSNKKHVLNQLDSTLAIKASKNRTGYADALEETSERRRKLDEYRKALHKKLDCGYSLYELINLFESVRGVKAIRLDANHAAQFTAEAIHTHEPMLNRMTAAYHGMDARELDLAKQIGISDCDFDTVKLCLEQAEKYRAAIDSMAETAGEIATLLGTSAPTRDADLQTLTDRVNLYLFASEYDPTAVPLMKLGLEEPEAYYARHAAMNAERDHLLQVWKPRFLTKDMGEFQTEYEAAGKKFFGRTAAMNALLEKLSHFKAGDAEITWEYIPELLKAVTEYQNSTAELEQADAELPTEKAEILKRYATYEEYQKAYETAQKDNQKATEYPGGLEAVIKLASDPHTNEVVEKYRSVLHSYAAAFEKFNNLLVRETGENDFESEKKLTLELAYQRRSLNNIARYNQLRKKCMEAGLQPVVDAFDQNPDRKDLLEGYRKGLYYVLINAAIGNDPVLFDFSGASFNEAVRSFRELDDNLQKQTKLEIYYRLAKNLPSSIDSPEVGRELALLRKAIGSNARGLSIRELFDKIPEILPRLCPVMLMSPNSVVQYLAQKPDLFDVVIFDEASQLPTCRAIGALARAKSAVIVGDPKQMPPTSFFAGSGPQLDDLELDDLDSILDDALALGIPSQYLQWHYRSTHESLIAFSNTEFYDNKMYTFPSANDRERHVTAVHVDGVYKNSTNLKEAEAVVAEIVRRFQDPALRGQSIGVVTFNIKQADLIQNLLEKQYQKLPELDSWAHSGEDPLFVKNLENSQGDERDVILFSIGYGPDEKGHISMNFGPINKAGGGKRLNVAFSRSRVTMTIFSSLYSSDFKLTETSPEGVKALHDFLKFAEGHTIQPEQADEESGNESRVGVMQSICKAIAEQGYQCVTMVGHSDFHVDIAVVDPYEPTKYILGILLDGEGYRQTKNTRDREVAQSSVLKHLGWNLARVWTVDWWDNRDKVLTRLLGKLDKLRAESEKRMEEKKAAEEAQKAEEAAREAEAERLKAELEAQAEEVIAEETEAEAESQKEQEPEETDTPVAEPVSEPVSGETETVETSETDHTEKQDTTETEETSSEEPEKTEEQHEPENVHQGSAEAETTETEPETQKLPDSEAIETSTEPVTETAEDPLAAVIQQVLDANGKIIDKRKNGGALWIVGGKNLTPIMKEFQKLGIHFIFKAGGGKATGGKDGWWAKTDVVLPAANNKKSTLAAGKTAEPAKTATEQPEQETQIQPTEEPKPQPANSENEQDNTETATPETETIDTNEEKTILKNIDEPTEYMEAVLPDSTLSVADFMAPGHKAEIAGRIIMVLEAEAPILKDALLKKVTNSFGITKSSAALETAEKILKATKVKTTKQKGVVFCWASGQDPKTYSGIRVSNDRSGDEICPQEIANAACYVLRKKGALPKDELVKEVSLLFGYKRLGKNLEAALTAGINSAKSAGILSATKDGVYSISQ